MSWGLVVLILLCFVVSTCLSVGLIVSFIMEDYKKEKEVKELYGKLKSGKYKVRFHL